MNQIKTLVALKRKVYTIDRMNTEDQEQEVITQVQIDLKTQESGVLVIKLTMVDIQDEEEEEESTVLVQSATA